MSSSQKPRLQSIIFSVGKYGSIYIDCSPGSTSLPTAIHQQKHPNGLRKHEGTFIIHHTSCLSSHQKLTLSSQTLASPLRRHLASQPAAQHQVLHKVLTPTANQINTSSSKLTQTVIIYLGICIPTCLTAREVVVSLSHLDTVYI